MKEHLYNFIRLTFFIIITTLVQGCGGSSSDKASDRYSISANTSTIVFANEFLQVADDTFKVSVNFTGNGLLVGYAPDSSPVGWLNYRTENVTASSAELYVTVVNAENIIADLYETKLRLSTGDVDKLSLVHHDIDVSLLVWQLIIDKEIVTFQSTLGDSAVNPQTLSITSESNLWTAESDVDWLSIDVSEGEGNGVITLTPNLSELTTAQLYQANIILTEQTTGDTKQVPVELGVDQHRLFTANSTLSFTKLNNVNETVKTLTIQTNSASNIAWQATTNVDWLTLTKVADSNELQVSINSSVSLNDAQNNATITIQGINTDSEVDATIIEEQIAVSYYQSNSDSENKTITDILSNNDAVITSPLLPHLYIGENNQIKVYHQYTAELLNTITVSAEGTLVEQLIIHPEGNLLLAKADETITNEDESTSTVTHRYSINLADSVVTELENFTTEFEPLQYVTFSGKHFVVTQALEYADDNLTRLFWDSENAFLTTQADQAKETQAFYALDFSDSSFKRYQATVNDFTTQEIVVAETHQYRPELLGENEAVSQFFVDDNESGIYAISPTSEWISFDGDTFIDNGLLPQTENSIIVTLTKSANNRAHYVRFVQPEGFYIDVYNEQQLLVNTIPTSLLQQPASIELSADDKRLILNVPSVDQVEIINIEQMNLSAESVNFNTTFGDSSIESQSVTISGVSDSWEVSSDQEWLIINDASAEDNKQIELSIDETKITGWGLFTGTVTITDPESGTSSAISINLAVDEVRLYSNYPALSFNAQTSRSLLTHTVSVLTNNASTIEWEASTEQNWITLTPNNNSNTLTITVDSAAVATNGNHAGLISLSPKSAGESLNGNIQVNFNKGNFNTADFGEVIIENVVPNSSGVVLDTMRPYLYVAQSDKINVYNIIDGSLVNSIQSPLADVNLTNLIIHPDSSLLMVSNVETYLDENEQEQQRTNYYHINLSDYSFEQLDNDVVDILSTPQKIIMVSGKPVMLTQAMELANLSLEQQYWDSENYFFTSFIRDVPNTPSFIAYDAANANLQTNTLIYNAFATKSVSIHSSSDYINPTFANGLTGISSNNDGTDLYTINAASEWSMLSGDTYLDQGTLDGNLLTTPVAVVTDSQNNSYFYRFDFSIGFFTLNRYNENQENTLVAGFTAGSADVYIAPDYHRVIHYNATDEQLVIDFMPE